MERKLLSVCVALLLVSGWVVSGCTRWNAEAEYQPRRVPAVSSTQLSATEIVPTLDTPFAKSGNAVWCATFQAAWNRVRDDLIREPVQLSQLQDADILAIPNVAFDVEHEFAELQGQIVENEGEFQGLPVVSACQKVRFRLDKSGAALASESDMVLSCLPRNFTVDRPFLIVMKERTAEQPYFMAWIENPELLEPEQAQRWFVSPIAIGPAIVAAIAIGLIICRRRKLVGKTRAAIFAGILPLWIWLEAVVLVSVFAVPSDPASKLLASTFGLIWLCLGFIFGCSWPVILRMIPLLLWGIMVAWASLSFDRPYFITGAAAYALVSVMAGAWSWRCLPVGRTRMLASFCTGHLIGSLAGTFGTIIGAVFGTVIGVYMMPPDTTASRETSDGRQAGIDGK